MKTYRLIAFLISLLLTLWMGRYLGAREANQNHQCFTSTPAIPEILNKSIFSNLQPQMSLCSDSATRYCLAWSENSPEEDAEFMKVRDQANANFVLVKDKAWEKYDQYKMKLWDEYRAFEKSELLKVKKADPQAYCDFLETEKFIEIRRRFDMFDTIPSLNAFNLETTAQYQIYEQAQINAYNQYLQEIAAAGDYRDQTIATARERLTKK